MQPDTPAGDRAGMYAAYVSAALFVVMFVAFSVPALAVTTAYLGIAIHILLFPVIAAAPAAGWGRAAGYGWLVVDNVASVLAINGLDFDMPVRLGGHLAAAVWVFAASARSSSWHRILGFLVCTIVFGMISLVPVNGPSWAAWLLPAGLPLFVIWLWGVGYRLGRR